MYLPATKLANWRRTDYRGSVKATMPVPILVPVGLVGANDRGEIRVPRSYDEQASLCSHGA